MIRVSYSVFVRRDIMVSAKPRCSNISGKSLSRNLNMNVDRMKNSFIILLNTRNCSGKITIGHEREVLEISVSL